MPAKISPSRHLHIGRSRAGLGLFARVPIRKGQFILRYSGRKISTETADDLDTRYLFEINTRWTIDGATRRNTARYINHSCRPNAEVYFVGQVIKIRAIKNIKPGEESTADGMGLDRDGRLYVTTVRGIQVFDTKGGYLGTITVPRQPSNVAFSGPDKKTLYISARQGLYRLKMLSQGPDRLGK